MKKILEMYILRSPLRQQNICQKILDVKKDDGEEWN